MKFNVDSTSGDIEWHEKEFSSLEELIKFCEEHGDIVILKPDGNWTSWRIEIYDDYRE